MNKRLPSQGPSSTIPDPIVWLQLPLPPLISGRIWFPTGPWKVSLKLFLWASTKITSWQLPQWLIRQELGFVTKKAKAISSLELEGRVCQLREQTKVILAIAEINFSRRTKATPLEREFSTRWTLRVHINSLPASVLGYLETVSD